MIRRVDEASRRIDLGTHALRIRESGAGGDAYVLLHDFLDGPDVWRELAAGLGERGRVIALQQRGHDDSTAPRGACRREDLAADVLAVLDALGIPRATLVGHGLGGVAALAAALASPERVARLVLIATPVEHDAAAARRWADVVRAGEVNKLQGLARSMWGPTSRRGVEGDGVALTELARLLQGLHADPLTPRLAGVGCPTLVLAGEQDAAGTASARLVAERIPGALLRPVAAAGVAPHVERPDAVLAEIRAFAG
jgi:pimeloyl-ACP methyl ester carboxylesterase